MSISDIEENLKKNAISNAKVHKISTLLTVMVFVGLSYAWAMHSPEKHIGAIWVASLITVFFIARKAITIAFTRILLPVCKVDHFWMQKDIQTAVMSAEEKQANETIVKLSQVVGNDIYSRQDIGTNMVINPVGIIIRNLAANHITIVRSIMLTVGAAFLFDYLNVNRSLNFEIADLTACFIIMGAFAITQLLAAIRIQKKIENIENVEII